MLCLYHVKTIFVVVKTYHFHITFISLELLIIFKILFIFSTNTLHLIVFALLIFFKIIHALVLRDIPLISQGCKNIVGYGKPFPLPNLACKFTGNNNESLKDSTM